MRKMICWTLSIAALAVLAAGCETMGDQEAAHPSEDEMKAAAGDKALFKEQCAKCHDLARVEEAHEAMEREEMRKVIQRMQAKPGAEIQPSQIDRYLDEIYGPDPGAQ